VGQQCHIPIARGNPSSQLLGRLLGIFFVVESHTRIGCTAWTPDDVLASSIAGLAELVPDVGTTFDVAIQLADSSCVFQTTIHGNLPTLAALEVMAMCGDNDIATLETLDSVEKQLHGLRFLGSRYSQGHLKPATPMA